LIIDCGYRARTATAGTQAAWQAQKPSAPRVPSYIEM
jgi:hypothetical protein